MARVPSEAARVLGTRIRAARLRREWTQDRLAAACGIDSANIRSYEAGRQMMNVHSLIRIAAALEVSAGELIEPLRPDMFPGGGVEVHLPERLRGERRGEREDTSRDKPQDDPRGEQRSPLQDRRRGEHQRGA
jgi:transcriptional regulator with XRE-family HTH domain